MRESNDEVNNTHRRIEEEYFFVHEIDSSSLTQNETAPKTKPRRSITLRVQDRQELGQQKRRESQSTNPTTPKLTSFPSDPENQEIAVELLNNKTNRLFLVEHKATCKRYNVYHSAFKELDEAQQFFSDHWRQRVSFHHAHLVPISDIFIQQQELRQQMEQEDVMSSSEANSGVDNSDDQLNNSTPTSPTPPSTTVSQLSSSKPLIIYHTYVVKERYSDNLMNFVESKRTNKTHISEKVILDYISQLLSSVAYLHSRGFIHAPGEISTDRLFLTNLYVDILLDAGKSNKFVSDYELVQNSHLYLRNAFVSPECKLFLISDTNTGTFSLTEKSDVYSLGVIVFILMTLMTDSLHLANFFLAPRTKNYVAYLAHLKDQITSMTADADYSKSLINFVVRMLHPSPDRRASIKQLTDSLFFEFNQDLPPQKQQDQKQSIFQIFQSASESEEELQITSTDFSGNTIVKIRDKTIKIKNHSVEQFAEMHIIRNSKIIMEGTMKKIKRKKSVPRYFYLTECNFMYCCLSELNPSTVTRKIKLIPNAFSVTLKGTGFKLATKDVTFLLEPEPKSMRDLWIKTLTSLSYNPKALPLEVHTSDIDTSSSRLLLRDAELETFEEFEKQYETIKSIEKLTMLDQDSISIVNHIGSGSFGSVSIISALNSGINERLAMKCMSVELESSEFEHFYSDLKCALNLNHDGILKIKAIGFKRNQICLFYDYVSLGTLSSLLSIGIPFKTKLDVMYKAAQALMYLHSKDIVHENLKPNNILVGKDFSNTVVTDFGFASLKMKLLGKTPYNILFQYLPPERMNITSKDSDIDKAGDVFSFAVIMSEWLTGRPWVMDKLFPMEIMQKIKDGSRPELPSSEAMLNQKRIQENEREVYDAMIKMLEQCWVSDPLQRLTFAQVVSHMNDVLSS